MLIRRKGFISKHHYTICWLHLVWCTKSRNPYFLDEVIAKKVLTVLKDICVENEIYYKVGYVNPEHVHLLIDLPVSLSIADVMQLLKGSSSRYINKHNFINQKFSWARGYCALSVSALQVDNVIDYVIHQKQHHQEIPFKIEWEDYKKQCSYHLESRS